MHGNIDTPDSSSLINLMFNIWSLTPELEYESYRVFTVQKPAHIEASSCFSAPALTFQFPS
ncbi:hypothetical protein QQP08_024389 [Theobroma cacao]|nr:hypothetical protein QQP08_024389 [Theobroma cacao]